MPILFMCVLNINAPHVMIKPQRSRPIVSKNINHFIENGGIAMATHDQYMKITWCNNSFTDMFEYKEDLVGKTLFDLCPREVDRVSRFVSKFREGTSKTVSTSLHMRTGPGTDRYIVINSEKFMGEHGNIDEIISCFRDDTKRMIREDRIKTALESSSHVSRHRGMFISKIVHELRNPITELMLTIQDDDKCVPYALSISRQIKNMTYATKFETGEFIVPTEDACCVKDVLESSIMTSRVGVTTDINTIINSTILVDGEKIVNGDSLYVYMDETLVLTVLSELLRNCCQLKDLIVSISAEINTKSNRLTFRVVDNGPGMNLSWILRVFQDFWGESSGKGTANIIDSMTTDAPGMGIGLNICYNIVQCMNSTLEVKTSIHGTEFWFEIDTTILEEDYLIRNDELRSDVIYNWSKMYIDDKKIKTVTVPSHHKKRDSTTKVSLVDKFRNFVKKNSTPITPHLATNSIKVEYPEEEEEEEKSSSNHTSGDKDGSSIAGESGSVNDQPKDEKSSNSQHNKILYSYQKGRNSSNSHKSNRERRYNKDSSGRHGGSIATGDSFSTHILIVDDNTVVRKLCGRILTNIGCTFDTAENGALAIEKVKKHHEYYYDLILMDLRMPLMNGLDATRIITEDLQLSIPIVAFTAEDSIDVFKEALDAGACGFLHKPATHENIEHTIDRYSRRI